MIWLGLAALLVLGCSEPAKGEPTAAPPCRDDRDCTGGWTPGSNACGPLERCLGGRCAMPPAITGAANAETGQITFALPGGSKAWQVEVVRPPFQTARGMMCRTSMHAGWGMLFLLPSLRPQRFWMKNTLISLDMVFLDEGWRIAGVVHDATPQSLESRGVEEPSRYVLELAGGEARAAGLVAGVQATFEPRRH